MNHFSYAPDIFKNFQTYLENTSQVMMSAGFLL